MRATLRKQNACFLDWKCPSAGKVAKKCESYTADANSARSSALRLRKSRKCAELPHQSKCIPTDIRIDDLTVSEVMNRDSLDRDFLVGWADSHEVTLMRPGNRPRSHQLVLFRHRVFDGEPQIREGCQVLRDQSPVSLRAHG